MKTFISMFIFMIVFNIPLIADGLQPFGTGTEREPYQIARIEHLLWVSTNCLSWSDHFIQVHDINASDMQDWNEGEGFSPIGVSYLNPFRGNYNGQNYTIDGFYINRPDSSCQGLFGYTRSAHISNVKMNNVYIEANVFVGSLIGNNYENCSVDNCSSNGTVIGSNKVGGLIGQNYNYCVVSNCNSFCSIESGWWYSAGLVGYNKNSTITNCYSGGSIDGLSRVGGLVGYNFYSIINNCYSKCFVDGYIAGGLVGLNLNSIISNCYSCGYVDGYGGGLVGENNSAEVVNSFWDTETSGKTLSAGGTGKRTSEMKSVATYTDTTIEGLEIPWDLIGNPYDDNGNEDYWDIDEETNDGYPFLRFTVTNIKKEYASSMSKLLNNFPNPFNSYTKISFNLSELNWECAEISIFNSKGQKVKTLVQSELTKGSHSIVWNGDDDNNKPVGTGIYYYKLNVNGKTEVVKKCLMLK